MVIIKPSQLVNVGSSVAQTTNTLAQATSGGDLFGDMNIDLDKVLQLADKVNNIVGQISKFRNQVSPKPAPTVQNMSLSGSPANIPATNNKEEIKEVVQVKEKVLSDKKIKELLKNVIVSMAEDLPEEIKESKIGDLTGKNFEKYQFKYKGFPISGEIVLSQITKVLKTEIPKLYED